MNVFRSLTSHTFKSNIWRWRSNSTPLGDLLRVINIGLKPPLSPENIDHQLHKGRHWQNLPLISLSPGLLVVEPSSSPPSIWLAVSIFTGLPVVLWTYKCLMLFIFQRKVIYMGYAPPGARNEQLGRDTPVPKRLHCEEIQVRSEKNVIVHGLLVRQKGAETQLPSAVIVYFQGNAGNPLHRLPVFASLICPSNQLSTSSPPSSTAVIAVAPRSYWKSTNRMPTQQSLIRDYTAVLSHTHKLFPTSPIIIYGHSLGAAIATCLLSSTTLTPGHHSLDDDGWKQNLKGVVLENPFTSVPDMVKALYPQKWLPYHYMGRFVWDKWDAVGSLRQDYTAATPKYPAGGGNGEKEAGYRGTVMESIIRDRRVLVLVSEKDEVVPPEMGHQLSAAMATRYFGSLGREGGHGEVGCRTVIIKDALHENAWTQRQWIDELTGFVERMRLQ